MSSAERDEVGLELRLLSAAGAARFLTGGGGAGDRVARLEDSLRSLLEEKLKIEAFKRELPLCVILVREVIGVLKEELEQCRSRRNGDGLPRKAAKEEEEEDDATAAVVKEEDCKDKRSWMSSAQLWSNGCITQSVDNSRFAGVVAATKEDLPLLSPETKNPRGSGHLLLYPPAETKQAAIRAPQPPVLSTQKARRCWSPELHRRFVVALHHLGGPQVATPKQIKEVMKVEGLTNDEVKSHLQKYRLHTRRSPAAAASSSCRLLIGGGGGSPSGSPQGPLQLAGASPAAISVTAGESCEEEEEDGRSESYSWK